MAGEPLPDVMQAVLLTGFGGYERLEVRNDVTVPIPRAGEVLVRVTAAGVNNTDINTRVGWYATEPSRPEGDGGPGWSGDVPRFPRIQGADACGHIVAVGPEVAIERIGERVLVEPVFREPGAPLATAQYFGSEVDGGFAQYCVAPSRHAHAVASSWSDAELASFPCSGAAAANLVHRIALEPGERVLVTGASGGVGSSAVQLTSAGGAVVVAVAAPDKAAELREAGASEVVTRNDDLVERFGPNSFDAVIDVVGGSGWPALLDVLRPGGRYATAGAVGGPLVPLDLRTLYLKDLRLIGATVLDEGVFAGLVESIEHGDIRPLVARTFPLHEIVSAQECFLTRRHVGKIVIEIP